MDKYALRALARISAINAKVQGMLAANQYAQSIGIQSPYDEQHFNACAYELEELAHEVITQ